MKVREREGESEQLRDPEETGGESAARLVVTTDDSSALPPKSLTLLYPFLPLTYSVVGG